jgi:hypothetical protein
LTFDLWPWKSIGFQILLRTKYVPSLVKIHWRMLILECSQGCYGRTEGQKDGRSITITLRKFVCEGIKRARVVLIVFDDVLYHVRYYTVTISYRRSTRIRYQITYILISDENITGMKTKCLWNIVNSSLFVEY